MWEASSDEKRAAVSEIYKQVCTPSAGSVEHALFSGAGVGLCCMDERVSLGRFSLKDPGSGILRVAKGQLSVDTLVATLSRMRVDLITSHEGCGASGLVTQMVLGKDAAAITRLKALIGEEGIDQIKKKGESAPDIAGCVFAQALANKTGVPYKHQGVNSKCPASPGNGILSRGAYLVTERVVN